VTEALKALVAAVIAALVLPLMFIAAESLLQWAPIVADDFGFAYSLVAPFALVTALAIAWPSYRLQPDRLPLPRRLLVAALVCFAVPVAMFLPLGDEFPWKAGVAGSVTLFLWLGAFSVTERFTSKPPSIRSTPSG